LTATGPPVSSNCRGPKTSAIEFHSLSKTYNMTGWRLGMVVGNREVIAALGKIKSNIDSGAFNAIQMAGIAALDSDQSCVAENCRIYQERRDVVVGGLRKLGYEVDAPKATFYVWLPVPKGFDSMGFTAHLLEQAGIVTVPGMGFGEPGEGYVRLALTVGQGPFGRSPGPTRKGVIRRKLQGGFGGALQGPTLASLKDHAPGTRGHYRNKTGGGLHRTGSQSGGTPAAIDRGPGPTG
jgi:hypothetical protein